MVAGEGAVLEVSGGAMRKRSVCEVPGGKMVASESHAAKMPPAEMPETAAPIATAKVSTEARFTGTGPQPKRADTGEE